MDIFVAFAANHSIGTDITESTLDDFERKELQNQKSNAQKAKTEAKTQRHVDFEFNEMGSDEEGDDVMGAYICTTPKVCYLCDTQYFTIH